MNLKQKLHERCEQILAQRLDILKNTILDIQTNLESETKSSAGDKHETGRAMLQLEREKIGQQLAEVQIQFEMLNKINPKSTHTKVAFGSVVFTSQYNYFIAVSCGELKIDDQKFYAVSPATPIAKLLISKTQGDTVSFRETSFSIVEIL